MRTRRVLQCAGMDNVVTQRYRCLHVMLPRTRNAPRKATWPHCRKGVRTMPSAVDLIDAVGFEQGMRLWHLRNEQQDAAIELIIMERLQWTNAAVDGWESI